MKRQFAVLGLGRFGSHLAVHLARRGYQVLAIDRDEKLVQQLSDQVTLAKVADCADVEALREAGVANCDAVIVAIGSNLEGSILATVAVKELGVPQIIAKAQNDMHGKILERVGATEVVYPEKDMALRLANRLTSANILDLIELSPDYTLLEEKVTTEMVGKSLAALDLDSKAGVAVVAIKRNDHILIGPPSNEKINPDDCLVIIGETAVLNKLITK